MWQPQGMGDTGAVGDFEIQQENETDDASPGMWTPRDMHDMDGPCDSEEEVLTPILDSDATQLPNNASSVGDTTALNPLESEEQISRNNSGTGPDASLALANKN